MIFVGIDPGNSGGIVAIDEKREVVFSGVLERMTQRDVLELLRDAAGYDMATGMLENVRSMPGEGHAGAWTFGRSFGNLEAFLLAAGIPFDYVTPQKWQARVGLRYPKNATKTVRKNLGKQLAQQLFPWMAATITHAIADALLIAEACRRNERGSVDGDASDHIPRRRERHGQGTKDGTRSEGREEEGGEERRRKPFDGWIPKGITRRHGPGGARSSSKAGASERAGVTGDGAVPGPRTRAARERRRRRAASSGGEPGD